jgi:hypothetical protein
MGIIGLMIEAFEAGYQAGRLSILGDLSGPSPVMPDVSLEMLLPPSGLVVHDICTTCGSTLIGPWNRRAETLELGREDAWQPGQCGDCATGGVGDSRTLRLDATEGQ